MIITHFPNTLGGVSFEKLVNYLGEGNPLRVRRPLANCYESRNLSLNPAFPWPRLRVAPKARKLFLRFLFLLVVVISFGYLAIYTPSRV